MVMLGWSLNFVGVFMPEAWGLMGGGAERAAVLEERGRGRFLLLAAGEAAVLSWEAIVVAGSGGAWAAADLVTREGAGIFEGPEGGEGARLGSRLCAVVELVVDVGLMVFVFGVDGGEGSYSFFRAS